MLLTSVIVTLKTCVSYLKTNGYQKMSDTNKNVTNMGVIIKRVYLLGLSPKWLAWC